MQWWMLVVFVIGGFYVFDKIRESQQKGKRASSDGDSMYDSGWSGDSSSSDSDSGDGGGDGGGE